MTKIIRCGFARLSSQKTLCFKELNTSFWSANNINNCTSKSTSKSGLADKDSPQTQIFIEIHFYSHPRHPANGCRPKPQYSFHISI